MLKRLTLILVVLASCRNEDEPAPVATKVLDLDRGQLAGWDCDYTTFLQRKQDLISDEEVYWERKTKKLAQEVLAAVNKGKDGMERTA